MQKLSNWLIKTDHGLHYSVLFIAAVISFKFAERDGAWSPVPLQLLALKVVCKCTHHFKESCIPMYFTEKFLIQEAEKGMKTEYSMSDLKHCGKNLI